MRPVRASLLLMAALTLSSCGFHPLYGPSNRPDVGSESSALATVRVNTIADRQGQKLRNYLIDNLQGDGVPPPPQYELIISYSESQADLGLNNDATTTRGQLTIGTSYTLKNLRTGVVETANGISQITGYNIQNSEFATILSRDDAEDRALKAIADNITVHLALFFRDPPKKTPPNPAAPPAKSTTPAGTFAPHAPGEALDNGSPITQTP